MAVHEPGSGLKLFAVCLGGRAPGCHVELHDVVFATGVTIESLYPRLRALWFGDPRGLHVDAWVMLDRLQGYRIELRRQPCGSDLKLYFVNIGGYRPGEFGERHAYAFYVGSGKAQVKQQARAELLFGERSVHRDDLFDIDDCIAVEPGSGWHIHLRADPGAGRPHIHNGYLPLPDVRPDNSPPA